MKELLNLIYTFGKNKINTLTKYPSILTLHKFGDKGRLTDELTTDIADEPLTATEKIDGTNVRIICWRDEYLIGSREFILHYGADVYFDPAQTIVESLYRLGVKIPQPEKLTVIYGELFGGKITAGSRNYGTEAVGFRVFDVAEFTNLSILELPLEQISEWREHETPDGLVYGQKFLSSGLAKTMYPDFEFVPEVYFYLPRNFSHEGILSSLKTYLPESNVPLTPSALKGAEGVILRNESRSKIFKLRFKDYERTLSQARKGK